MSNLPTNVKLWKINDFVIYCKQNPKYEVLEQFIRNNSIDGTFFFDLNAEDFTNIPELEIDKDGIQLFFELLEELKAYGGIENEQPNPPVFGDMNKAMEPLSLLITDFNNKSYEFNQSEIKIGRENQNHINYEDKSISRNHALIERVGNSYFIRDESSSNGTFVKLEPNHQYQLVQGMHFDIAKTAELCVIYNGLLQVKIKVNVENDEESQKEFNLALWAQQSWIIGSMNNQLVCENADNAQAFEVKHFEIKQANNRNVIKVLNDGIWNKIGCKDLKEIFKYYPLKKNDVIRVGDRIELNITANNAFEDFDGDSCLSCKIKYPESVEFINLDCKHLTFCRVCRQTEMLCSLCNEPIKNFEAISNVYEIDENELI